MKFSIKHEINESSIVVAKYSEGISCLPKTSRKKKIVTRKKLTNLLSEIPASHNSHIPSITRKKALLNVSKTHNLETI